MLKCALEDSDKFDKVYNLFSDEESRSTFDWFIQFRVAYAFLGEAARLIFPPAISHEEFLLELSRIKLDPSGIVNIGGYKFKSYPLEIVGSWIFEQYNLKGLCEVSLGDFVVDGGAFRGETALWFLSKGVHRVYAFEGDDMNFKVIKKNVELNKTEDKIIPVKTLLSGKDGISKMKMIGSGSSSALVNEGTKVECVALDSFVIKDNIERIDFIKLDVEGTELDVLNGATETIKKYKPKMAVSVYHKPDDIISIPLFLRDFLPEAKFYLRHFGDSFAETVLFVNPR